MTAEGPWLPSPALSLPAGERRLRLLSFNIQVGLRTRGYGDYLSQAWKHALPSRGRRRTLDQMAELLSDYDFVALQEADAGSVRSGFVDQVRYLAQRAGFPYHGVTVTRDLRPVAQHCMGYLSRLPAARSSEYLLPSRIPGRRALKVELGPEAAGLTLLLAHLSLGRGDQHRQLDFLGGLVPGTTPAVLLGDLNCDAERLRAHPGLGRSGLLLPEQSPLTFPSWRPVRGIDHILVTPQVRLHRIEALSHAISDHLPLSAEIALSLPG